MYIMWVLNIYVQRICVECFVAKIICEPIIIAANEIYNTIAKVPFSTYN